MRTKRSSRARHLSVLVALVGLVSATSTGVVAPAKAASTIAVDCAPDPAALVNAFAAANSGDTLAITGVCAGALDIAKDITLSGSGTAVLDGQGQAIRVITVRAGATVTIDGLTITGGHGFAGVGIHNLGTVTLANSTIRDNVAAFWGGGIYNRYGASLTVLNSVILGNSAGENAGGIYNDGTLTFTASNVAINSGGLGGGGVLNSSFGTMEIVRGTIYGNNAQYGGGLSNNGTLTVADSTIASNRATSGGGILLGGGSAVVERSTISDNEATTDGGGINHGGGIYYGGWRPPVLRNSTFVGNSAGGSGGGVANTGYIGSMTLDHLTITGNRASTSGAGIANLGYSGEIALTGTIVAASAVGPNCSGTITDGGYNLDDGMSCALTGASSLSNTDPRLDPDGLEYNGGTTKTVALQPTSPAIDAIPQADNGCGTSLTSDQRGVARPQGSACDIGAFELIPDTTPPVIDVPESVTADATTSAGAVVNYSASATDAVDGSVPVICSPSPGLFGIGDTPVVCTAADAAGNRAEASFTVHVKGAQEQISDLIALVDSYEIDMLGRSLHEKLVVAQKHLAALRPVQAEEVLNAFVLQVRAQRGRGLTGQQADQLESGALRIIDVIE